MDTLFLVALIILLGFFFGEIAEKIKLPKISGFIAAGILLNPSLNPYIPATFLQNSEPLVNLALAFIAFSLGGTLTYKKLKKTGKTALLLTLAAGESSLIFVFIGIFSFLLLPFNSFLTLGFLEILVLSLLIATLAMPTDPSATLAVIHQHHARGPVTDTILEIAALDDILSIFHFVITASIGAILIGNGNVSLGTASLKILIIILGGFFLGLLLGWVFNHLTCFICRETEGAHIVLIIGFLALAFSLARMLGFDEIITVIVMGLLVANFNPIAKKLFKILERYTEELIFIFFFTLSSMQIELSHLSQYYPLIIIFIAARSLGKYSGVYLGGHLSKSSLKIKNHTAGGLIPQGGMVIGLSLLLGENPAFSTFSDVIISTVIGATIIHEIFGPIIAYHALKQANEIHNKIK